jgi:hypothetical protein
VFTFVFAIAIEYHEALALGIAMALNFSKPLQRLEILRKPKKLCCQDVSSFSPLSKSYEYFTFT